MIVPPTAGSTSSQGAQNQRVCRVVIGGPIIPNDASIYNPAGLAGIFEDAATVIKRGQLIITEAAVAAGIRVRGSMEWSAINWMFNIGKVEIFGLSEEHRGFVSNQGTPVAVYAGYMAQAQNLPLVGILRSHQVTHIPPSQSEPTWITVFEGGDGGRSAANARVNASFAPGTPMAKVTELLGQALGKFSPGSKAVLEGAAAGRSFKNGYAYSGKAQREFKAMMEDMGLEHTIQNEEIIIVQRNQATQQVFLVTPDSGLIGSFAPMAPEPGKPKRYKGAVLLNAQLRPNATLVVQSANLNGPHRVLTVKHNWDTYSTDDKGWSTDLTIQALSN